MSARKTELEEARTKWFSAGREVVIQVVERRNVLFSLCPGFAAFDDEDRAKALKRLAELDKGIAASRSAMKALEAEGRGGFRGLRVLLGGEVDDAVHVAAALLVAKNLSSRLDREVATVSDVVELACGDDPVAALAVRSAFRSDGVLTPHVLLRHGQSLDDGRLRLSEKAFNAVLGLEPDVVTETLTEVAR